MAAELGDRQLLRDELRAAIDRGLDDEHLIREARQLIPLRRLRAQT
jgi:hypothetical protein